MSRCNMIARVTVVLNRTVIDSDRRFDNSSVDSVKVWLLT